MFQQEMVTQFVVSHGNYPNREAYMKFLVERDTDKGEGRSRSAVEEKNANQTKYM
jgi:hypothetical protein